ncbi:MAG: GWxTD domain-containing protein, partial [Candidatus Krumholzibacteriia bacterium]
NRRKKGILNAAKKRSASSECATDWVAELSPRPEQGIALEDPLFLVQAPMKSWDPDRQKLDSEPTGWLHDFVHPSRRYGLQEDHLQIFQPVWPAQEGVPMDYEPTGLRVEVINLDMDFALRDTIQFGERGRLALAAGRPAALFYELDVNLLPEGAYMLNLAPLDGQGRGSLTQFDVVWRLSALGRHRGRVLGEGRTVFAGGELKKFLDSSAAEQEKMLDDFWLELNPEPENPNNSAYLEFQYRIAYVQQFLDGFDEFGANDERGEVFIALGAPDALQTRRMPRNNNEQDFARSNVYDRYAFAEGAAPNSLGSVTGAQDIDSYGAVGGVDRASSHGADRDELVKFFSASHNFPFEFWEYDRGGSPLFPTQYSQKGMGQRFLFIDQLGTGEYSLDSSNVVQPDE